MPKTKVISVINYKGGVGKTTTTYHIGCALADQFDKKVLLVDIDPQTNLTFLCATVERWRKFKTNNGTIASMYRRYNEKQPPETKKHIWRDPVTAGRYAIEGLDLIPCDIDLLGEDLGGGGATGTFPTLQVLRQQSDVYLRDRLFLSRIVDEVDGEYDYVLIDCPPNLYLMTQNALIASHWYLVTAIPDHLSTIGLSILRDKVKKIGDMVNAAQTFATARRSPLNVAKLGGVVFVRVRIGGTMLTNLHWSTMEDVRSLLGGGMCFENYTTELIGYGEASTATVPVWLHDGPKCASSGCQERVPVHNQGILGEVQVSPAKRTTGLGSIGKALNDALEALPSSEDKAEIAKACDEIIRFLAELRDAALLLPSREEMGPARDSVERVQDLLENARGNRLVSSALGLRAPSRPGVSSRVTQEHIDRAQDEVRRLEALPEDELNRRLLSDKAYSARELRTLATVLGIGATKGLDRDGLARRIASKIVNYRGYKSLGQSPD